MFPASVTRRDRTCCTLSQKNKLFIYISISAIAFEYKSNTLLSTKLKAVTLSLVPSVESVSVWNSFRNFFFSTLPTLQDTWTEHYVIVGVVSSFQTVKCPVLFTVCINQKQLYILDYFLYSICIYYNLIFFPPSPCKMAVSIYCILNVYVWCHCIWSMSSALFYRHYIVLFLIYFFKQNFSQIK